MPTETCPYEASVLAARRSASPHTGLLEHLRQCPICMEICWVSDQIRDLGQLPNAPALADPDRLWLLARVSARQDEGIRALRNRVFQRVLNCGLLSAGTAWSFMSWLNSKQLGAYVWRPSLAWPYSDPVVSLAVAVLAGLGAALVVTDHLIGRQYIAKQLRSFGLL